MQKLSRWFVIACCASLPFTTVAGVTGTHGPDRGSGGPVAKPKPAPAEEQSGDQNTKPEEKEKKDVETVKDGK
jgi:hypothetical protein